MGTALDPRKPEKLITVLQCLPSLPRQGSAKLWKISAPQSDLSVLESAVSNRHIDEIATAQDMFGVQVCSSMSGLCADTLSSCHINFSQLIAYAFARECACS
jgi:hypothetical protein